MEIGIKEGESIEELLLVFQGLSEVEKMLLKKLVEKLEQNMF